MTYNNFFINKMGVVQTQGYVRALSLILEVERHFNFRRSNVINDIHRNKKLR